MTESVGRSGGPTWGGALRLVALLVAAVVFFYLVVNLQSVLFQLLFALILATGLGPLVRQLERSGMSRGLAVLLIYVLLIIALIVLGVAVIPPIVEQVEEFARDAPRHGDEIVELLRSLREQFPFLPPLDEQLVEYARQLSGQLGVLGAQALTVARFALGIFSGALSILLVLLITLYLIVDHERIRDYFLSFFSEERHEQLRRVSDRIGERMGGWLLGQVFLSLTVGLVSWIGLTLLGVNGAVVLAVLAAIGELIPIVGPIAAAVPAVLVGFTQSVYHGIAALVLYVAIQQLENNILVPKIMERAVAIHPLAVIIALLVGGELYGIVGAIVAVPVAASLAVVLNEFRRGGELSPAQKSRPPETASARQETEPVEA